MSLQDQLLEKVILFPVLFSFLFLYEEYENNYYTTKCFIRYLN